MIARLYSDYSQVSFRIRRVGEVNQRLFRISRILLGTECRHLPFEFLKIILRRTSEGCLFSRCCLLGVSLLTIKMEAKVSRDSVR